MKTATFLRATAYLAFVSFAPPFATWTARAQQSSNQQDSVAEVARRAREKKKNEKEPKKVITDDDLKPATPETVTSATAEVPRVPGSAATQAQGKVATDTSIQLAGPEDAAKAWEALAKAEADLARSKQQLENAQKDLDIAQREFTLQRQTYYSTPDYQHDTAGKAKLDDLARQVSDKKQEIEALKTKIAAQQDLVNRLKASAPAASNETKPPSPQP